MVKILTTHHHWDHAGGNNKLLESLPEKVPVYGGDDQLQALTNKVEHNDTIKVNYKIAKVVIYILVCLTCHIDLNDYHDHSFNQKIDKGSIKG